MYSPQYRSIFQWGGGEGEVIHDFTLLPPMRTPSQESAEVVHIDYNVCFDKGTKLRVPEIIPFRWG